MYHCQQLLQQQSKSKEDVSHDAALLDVLTKSKPIEKSFNDEQKAPAHSQLCCAARDGRLKSKHNRPKPSLDPEREKG